MCPARQPQAARKNNGKWLPQLRIRPELNFNKGPDATIKQTQMDDDTARNTWSTKQDGSKVQQVPNSTPKSRADKLRALVTKVNPAARVMKQRFTWNDRVMTKEGEIPGNYEQQEKGTWKAQKSRY